MRCPGWHESSTPERVSKNPTKCSDGQRAGDGPGQEQPISKPQHPRLQNKLAVDYCPPESSVAGPIERDSDGNRNLGVKHLQNQGESTRRALSQGFLF